MPPHPTPFQKQVYHLTQQISRGSITTYKEIGKKLGQRGQLYRAVGQALKHSPGLPEVPCHRVICSNGSLGGFNRGIKKKVCLLRKEGIIIKRNKIELKKYLFKF